MFAVGFLLRVGLAEYVLAQGIERLPDSDLYEAYARCIYSGGEYEVGDNHALRMPGYPAFLAVVWRVMGGESLRAVLYAQAILGTLTAWIVYRLARSFETSGAPRGTAWIAAAITLLEPYALILGSLELSETLFTTLFAGCIGLAKSTHQKRSALRATLLGFLIAAAVYVRPSAILLGPITAALYLMFAKDRMPALRWVAMAAIVGAIILAPWWVRNARLYGRPVLTTLNVGESLYDGWNPMATGASDMSFKRDKETPPMTELESDTYWREQAFTFAREHPAKVLTLAAQKFLRFWSPWPNEPRFRTPTITTVTTIASLAFYGLAIVGLIAILRGPAENRAAAWFVLVPIAYYTALHAVFVSSVRYRVPLVPVLALAAGWGCATLLQRTISPHGKNTRE